jgi:hypothetical protein
LLLFLCHVLFVGCDLHELEEAGEQQELEDEFDELACRLSKTSRPKAMT